jgi:formylglycine-generating enzyme required for sulfatase activity/energy-coupling factor transporter ATP-binding protein EcfA2
MAFDLKRWQSEVRAWWGERGPRIKAAPIESAYALLAASAWLPFLVTYVDDPGPAMTALVGVTAGIGSNLVANVVQNIYDRGRGGEQVTGQAREDAQTRAEVDAILQATQALEAAQEALGERWDDFARQLAQEMAALPGKPGLTVALGDGTVVEGSLVAGNLEIRDGTFVGRDYIETQTIQVGIPPSETQEHVLRHRYLGELAAEVNRLPWASLDPDYADPSRGESMGLADVYTALDTTELEHIEREDELRAFLARQTEARRIPTQEMIDREPRLLLLGDPGSGKSTLVNFLTYVLAQAGRAQDPAPWLERLEPWSHGSILPLRIILREFAATLPTESERGRANLLLRHLETVLDEWGLTPFWPHLRQMLGEREQPILILLDGLDEVPSDLRRVVVESVDDFAGRYAWHRYLVTCRPYAYIGQPWRLNGFRQVTLAPFSEEQVAHFITAWYDELARRGRFTRAQATARAGRLQAAATRADLRGLAERPLLLTVMALLHTFRGQLPDDRVELYRWTVDLLLRRWEGRVGDEQGILETLALPGLKMSDLEAGLYEVAFRAHQHQGEAEGTADIAEGDLRNWLAPYLGGSWDRAGNFVAYIRERAGLLVRHKPAAYTFPHRTFQEFLAACHLTGHSDFSAEAARLARRDPDRWRVVYVLATGHASRTHRLGSALSAVNALCPEPCVPGSETRDDNWRVAILAGEALLEIGLVGVQREPMGRAVLKRTQGWLAELLETGALEPMERAAAGRVLAHLGDPRNLDAVVFVPGGPFMMGSREGDEGAYDDEYPQHTVEVDDFSISKYPVTNMQYARFIEAGGYEERRYWTETGWDWRTGLREPDLSTIDDKDLRQRYADWLAQRPPEKRDRPFWWDDPTWNLPNHPVVGVSWFEALAYCAWLAEATGRPCRLPTEAEWEKAARGTDGRTYPWGDEWAEDRANTSEAEIGRTTAVGAFPAGASPCGTLDMSGNVLEWCSSVGFMEAPYPYRADDGREDLERDAFRAVRGGSWSLSRRDARCACRVGLHPGTFDIDSGFRVVFPGSPPSDS